MNRSSSRSSPARRENPDQIHLGPILGLVGIRRRRFDQRSRCFEQIESAHDQRGVLVERLEDLRGDADPVFGSLLWRAGRLFATLRKKSWARSFARSSASRTSGALSPVSARSDEAFTIPRELVEAVCAHRDAEVLSRHVLELVGLVDDRVAALGDHFSVRALAHSRVRT